MCYHHYRASDQWLTRTCVYLSAASRRRGGLGGPAPSNRLPGCFAHPAEEAPPGWATPEKVVAGRQCLGWASWGPKTLGEPHPTATPSHVDDQGPLCGEALGTRRGGRAFTVIAVKAGAKQGLPSDYPFSRGCGGCISSKPIAEQHWN